MAFCTCLPSGNQVDGSPLALVRMLCQLVDVTRTEGISVRVIRMLVQLVGLGSVERASVKSDVFF